MSQAPGGAKGKRGEPFPVDFFNALHKGDEDEAVARMRANAIPEGGAPSPRAEALINSGEWDSNQKLSLVLIEANSCSGKVGNDDYRFCGKAPNFCTIAAHSKHTVGPIQRGWYISFGKAHGVLTSPFLPPSEMGGPISSLAAARLLSNENPFRLTKGQWKFVLDSWYALKVEVLSEDSKEHTIEFNDNISKHSSVLDVGEDLLLGVNTDVLPEYTDYENHFQDDKDEAESAEINEDDPQFIWAALRKLQAEAKARERALQSEQTYLLSQVEQLTRRNRELEAQTELLNGRWAQSENAAQRLHRIREEESKQAELRFRSLQAQVTHIETLYQGDGAQIRGGDQTAGEVPQDVLDKVEELDVAVFGSSGTFARFREGFIEFKEKLESGGGVECHGVSFKSQRDFLVWFGREGPTVDIFLDGLAYMHAIRAPVVHMDDATKQLELQMRTELATGLEASVLTSFVTILPSILVGSGGKRGEAAMGGTKDWLSGYLKSFETWKPSGSSNGVSHQISDGVKSVTRRVNELRKMYATPEVVMLSAGLCQDSALFCNEFVRYINEQQEELTNNTAYSSQQVWDMQLECIQKIVEELSQAREGMADAGRADRGNFVWGMLMAWRIQQRYMENHFKDDPALTGVLVRRILLQGQDTSVKKQLAKVDVTEAKLEEYKRNNNAELKRVKDEVTKLKEDLAKVKK